MKKRIILIGCSVLLVLAGCGAESKKESAEQKEAASAAEIMQAVTEEETVSSEPADDSSSEAEITQEQALEAIKNYCYESNPELESMADSEDVTVYFDVSTNEANEIVVLYRSYTGAQIRYYIDPVSGEVYVTELVPGIIDEEQKTDETFNIRDYLNKTAGSAGVSTGASAAETAGDTSRKDGERFEDVIMLEGMEEPVNYEHAVNNDLGIEIDFEYDSLARKSDSDKERFISIYDDTDKPDNYLEVTYRPENSDAVTASVSDELSKEYEIITDQCQLDKAGSCTEIVTSGGANGAAAPEKLQTVYIIPAKDGSLVAVAHYTIESAEGFGHRFDYMMNTLLII